jgi:hypothetical protein
LDRTRPSDLGDPAALPCPRTPASWIDSGINALSVLSRFVEPVGRMSLRRLGPTSWSCYEGRIACRGSDFNLEALIITNWHVSAPARSTRITYASGMELVLDHHAVSGYLIRNGEVREFFGSSGRVPRRESHYRALYRSFLTDRQPIMEAERSRRLHDLLLRPVTYP